MASQIRINMFVSLFAESFYQALTNELARNPNGFQGGNAGGGAPQNQGFRK